MIDKGQHLDWHQNGASVVGSNHNPQSEDHWEKLEAASIEQLCLASWWSLQPDNAAHHLNKIIQF